MQKSWIALIGTVLLVGSGFGEAWPANDTTIHISLTAPITGEYAEYGNYFKHSVEMAIDEINANGGVLNKKFKFSVGDFTSTCCMAGHPPGLSGGGRD